MSCLFCATVALGSCARFAARGAGSGGRHASRAGQRQGMKASCLVRGSNVGSLGPPWLTRRQDARRWSRDSIAQLFKRRFVPHVDSAGPSSLPVVQHEKKVESTFFVVFPNRFATTYLSFFLSLTTTSVPQPASPVEDYNLYAMYPRRSSSPRGSGASSSCKKT